MRTSPVVSVALEGAAVGGCEALTGSLARDVLGSGEWVRSDGGVAARRLLERVRPETLSSIAHVLKLTECLFGKRHSSRLRPELQNGEPVVLA